MPTRQECALRVKQAIAKVRKYDEELADEIINELADYDMAREREENEHKR